MMLLNWVNRHLNHLISIAIAFSVIYIALQQGHDLVDAFKQVRLDWAIAGLVCYGGNYLFRAVRIKSAIKGRIRMWPQAVHTACLHGLATYLLPFRSGDLTLPVILNKVTNLTFTSGAKVLINIRLLDLFALGILILVAAIMIDVDLPTLVHVVWLLFGLVLAFCPIFIKPCAKLGERFLGDVGARISQWGKKISYTTVGVLSSLGIWICIGACFFCTARSIGLQLGFMEVWLLITLQLPLQMIPLQGVANAGNHEGGWIVGLALLGIPADQGLHFALLSHALMLSYVLLLGPFAFFLKGSNKKMKQS